MNPPIKNSLRRRWGLLSMFLFVFSWSSSQRLYSQTVIFSEGFESSSLGGWAVSDEETASGIAFWESRDSTFGTVAPLSGARKGYCAGSAYAATGSHPSPSYFNSMVSSMSRTLDLRNFSSAELSYAFNVPSLSSGDRLEVRIDGQAIFSFSSPTATWTTRTVDLGAYVGDAVTLEFLFISGISGVAEGAYLDDIQVTGSQLSEHVVFGTGERTTLLNPASEQIEILDRAEVASSNHNYDSVKKRDVSIIFNGTVTIDQNNDPELIYSRFFNGTANDLGSIEIIAEEVVIRSPLRAKGADVSIIARTLRMEGNGQITTTPEEITTTAADATSESSPGADGADGLSAGDIVIHVDRYFDNTTDSEENFVLDGGAGQAAGRGRHGSNGVSVPNKASHDATLLDFVGNPQVTTYTASDGFRITRVESTGISAQGVVYGSDAFPTNGTNAWPSGTPGNGGNGGTLRTNNTLIDGDYGRGSSGAKGIPSPTSQNRSTSFCVGGLGGSPTKSIQISYYRAGLSSTAVFEEGLTNTTTDGTSYAIPSGSFGSAGSRQAVGDSYSWLHPLLVRKVLDDAKDDYLQNRIPELSSVLEEYVGLIGEFRNDASWSTSEHRLELGQLYDEMVILLQQLANGLDYFGNPGGWVPMLSFEVNANLFDQEIDRSLDIIYLSQWISSKQDDAAAMVQALSTARDKLAEEMEAAQDEYANARAELSTLQGEAQNLTNETNQLLVDLQVEDQKLRTRAEQNLQPEEWEVGLRAGLKVAGTLASAIPFGQPAVGTVGELAVVGSDFDPDEPWDSIAAGLDVASTGLLAQVEQNLADQEAEIADSALNPQQLKAQNATQARNDRLETMANGAAAVSSTIGVMTEVVEGTKIPESQIQEELERLRSEDPSYGALVDRIEAVTEKRRDYADRVIAAVINAATQSDIITRGVLAMSAMSEASTQSANIIDANVNSYLKDMERRAFDRLLRYHYYMAKAYEYRLVTPYNGQLDLEDLFNQIQEIATSANPSLEPAASDGSITDGQRDLLNSVFREIVASTTESIITDYNQNPSIPGSSLTYQLNEEELAALNRGETVDFNFVERGFFPPTEENIRIVDLRLLDGGMETSGTYGSPAFVDLCMEHSGVSNLRLEGEVYQFRHYNQETRQAITWKGRYEPASDLISPTPLVPANDSLLRSLLPNLSTDDLVLYSRPAADADIRIWRSGVNGGQFFGLGSESPPILLEEVTLQIVYDRTLRVSSPARRNLEVITSQTASGAPLANDDLLPRFELSREDVNGRQDSLGRFVRVYDSSANNPVTVTAPNAYGTLQFSKWTDSSGNSLGSSPSLTVQPSSDQKVFAIYESGVPTVTSALAQTGAYETFFSYQITTDTPADRFVAVGLPAGLELNPTSGLISGVPRIAGTFEVVLSAVDDDFGPGVPSVLTLDITGTDVFDSAIETTLVNNGRTVLGTLSNGQARMIRLVVPESGTLFVNTANSNFDTVLEVYAGSSREDLRLIDENDDNALPNDLTSEVALQVTAGMDLYFVIDSFSPTTTGVFNLNLDLTNGADFQISTAGNRIEITEFSSGGGDLAMANVESGELRFVAIGKTFSVDGSIPVHDQTFAISLNNVTEIIINTEEGDDDIEILSFVDPVPSLTINGGRGNDSVSFNGTLNFANGEDLFVDLLGNGEAFFNQVIFESTANITASGGGAIEIYSGGSIDSRSGAMIQTADGAIIWEANQEAPFADASFIGIRIDGSTVQSQAGPMEFFGRGGGTGATKDESGIRILGGAQVLSNGVEPLYLTGRGGSGANSFNNGIWILSGALVRSNLAIVIEGVAGSNSSSEAIGILVADGELDSPEVYLDGLGGGVAQSATNHGVEITSMAELGSATSFVQIKGVSGEGAHSDIAISNTAVAVQGIALECDSCEIEGTASVSASLAIIEPIDAPVTVLGDSGAVGDLILSDAFLDRIDAGEFEIGGDVVRLSQNVSRGVATDFYLYALSIEATPGVSFQLAGGSLAIDAFERLSFPVNAAVLAGLPSVVASDQVILFEGRNELELQNESAVGSIGDSVTLIDNQGSSPVQGTFANLPEGSVIDWPNNPMIGASISYQGGDGNDVTLTLEANSGYEAWVAANVAAGKDASFAGDADGDGVSNGVEYVFGGAPTLLKEPGILFAPPSLPADVTLILERSTSLTESTWPLVGTWTSQGVTFEDGFVEVQGEIWEAVADPRAFYRYRVLQP